MHPVRTESQTAQSQVVKKSLNPSYHEIFPIPISDDEIQNGCMVVQVWDQDVMDHDDFIGEAIIYMNTFDFSLNPIHTAWYTLKAEVNIHILIFTSS